MKLLLDANLSWRLAELLSEYFNECKHVNQTKLSKPAKDTEIWNYAAENGYTIITQDSDFLNLFYTRVYPPKIVLLSIGNMSKKEAGTLLIQSKAAIDDLEKNDYGLLEIYGSLEIIR
jgi:predicted nuclease of predicted toxin-antitoxin system